MTGRSLQVAMYNNNNYYLFIYLFIHLFHWFISKVIKQLQQRVYNTLTEKQGQPALTAFQIKLSIKTNTYSLQTTTTGK